MKIPVVRMMKINQLIDRSILPDVHISPPGPVYQYDTERRLPGINSETVYQQPIIYSQHTLKPTTLQNQQIIQTRPQISQQVQRNQQLNTQITQQFNHHHQHQQQQHQQQRGSQSHIHRISQLQQRPVTSISGQQITQQHQQNGQVTFLPGARKPNGEGLDTQQVVLETREKSSRFTTIDFSPRIDGHRDVRWKRR